MIAPKPSDDAPVIDQLNEEVAFLNSALFVARMGPWEFYPGLGAIYLSAQWAAIFGIEKPPERFTEYLALIDPSDRKRVAGEIKRIFLLGEGNQWESRHRLAGRVIHSRALAAEPGRVVGVDMDISNGLPAGCHWLLASQC